MLRLCRGKVMLLASTGPRYSGSQHLIRLVSCANVRTCPRARVNTHARATAGTVQCQGDLSLNRNLRIQENGIRRQHQRHKRKNGMVTSLSKSTSALSTLLLPSCSAARNTTHTSRLFRQRRRRSFHHPHELVISERPDLVLSE